MLANCVMLAVVLSLDQSSLPGRWLPADACDERGVSHREFFCLHRALHKVIACIACGDSYSQRIYDSLSPRNSKKPISKLYPS